MFATVDVLERPQKGDWKLRIVYSAPRPSRHSKSALRDQVLDTYGAIYENEAAALAAADQAKAALDTLGIELREKVGA